MTRDIGVVEVFGLGLAGLAGLLAVRPGLAAQAGFGGLLSAVGNGYFLAVGVGALAGFYGLFVGMWWWIAGNVVQAEPPAVETFAESAVPGTAFDEALPELAGERGRAVRPVEHREWIRERLRTDAVRTVARVRNVDIEAAGSQVESGDWTDNRYAADFVGGESAPRPRPHRRLLDWTLRRDPFTRRARQTVAALVDLEEGGP